MIRFLADEDFNGHIIRGLLRREPALDIVRVQEVGLMGQADSILLAWAEHEGRVLLTHDVSTMTDHAYERMHRGHRVAGVIEVPQSLAIGQAIEDILLIANLSSGEELENQVQYLPL
ncbi:MAG: DUF5615 family PIN-like protein [Anaerolineae bacterium]|nr:DUF5615 family PIN-like protein [Anaerolineae bacterium]